MVREGEGMLAGPCGQRGRRTVTVAAAIIPAPLGVVNVVGIRLDYSRTKRKPKRARNLYAMQATLGMMRKIHKASRIAQLHRHGVHGHAHPGGGDRGGARH